MAYCERTKCIYNSDLEDDDLDCCTLRKITIYEDGKCTNMEEDEIEVRAAYTSGYADGMADAHNEIGCECCNFEDHLKSIHAHFNKVIMAFKTDYDSYNTSVRTFDNPKYCPMCGRKL